MDILYSLSYDRKPIFEEPLTQVVQTLWKHRIERISRFAESTLEFEISGLIENIISAKALELAEDLEKIIFVRLSRVYGSVIGEGNDKLNTSLAEHIDRVVNAGILKRPEG